MENTQQEMNIIDSFTNVVKIKNLTDKTVVLLKPESCIINFSDDENLHTLHDYLLTITVSIQIKYWIVNNKIIDSYYIVSYKSDMNEQNKIYHPFYRDENYDYSSYDGEIIKKNAMTEQMINY